MSKEQHDQLVQEYMEEIPVTKEIFKQFFISSHFKDWFRYRHSDMSSYNQRDFNDLQEFIKENAKEDLGLGEKELNYLAKQLNGFNIEDRIIHTKNAGNAINFITDAIYEKLNKKSFLNNLFSASYRYMQISPSNFVDKKKLEDIVGVKIINAPKLMNFANELIGDDKELLKKVIFLVENKQYYSFKDEVLQTTLKVLEKNKNDINGNDIDFLKEKMNAVWKFSANFYSNNVYSNEKKNILEKIIKIFSKNDPILINFCENYFKVILNENESFRKDINQFAQKNGVDLDKLLGKAQIKQIDDFCDSNELGTMFLFKVNKQVVLNKSDDLRKRHKNPEQELRVLVNQFIKKVESYIKEKIEPNFIFIKEGISMVDFNDICVALNTEEKIIKYKAIVEVINKNQDFLFDKVKNKEDFSSELDKMILAEKVKEATQKDKFDKTDKADNNKQGFKI